MNTIEFAKDKRDEILALATRHKATDIRVVVPETASANESGALASSSFKVVATFTGDSEAPQYFEALMAFQTDLEMWLEVNVHVYDARGFKGEDGEEFLRNTRLLSEL